MGKPDIIREMQQSDQVVHMIGSKQADDLVKAGLVRRVTVSPPAPKGRTAVNLTARGKAYRGGRITPAEQPQDEKAERLADKSDES